MKCLIIDRVDDCVARELGKYMQVDTALNLRHDGLEKRIGEYEVLIMRVTPRIDEEVLKYADRLRYIGVCSIGLDHIDLNACKARGITVQNAPGFSANAVAELTLCKMLELSRDTIPAHNDITLKHQWTKTRFRGQELYGRTVGILGFGRIGQKVGRLCRAFGMKVMAYDPFLPAEIFAKEEAESASITEVLENADYVTIHVPLTPDTRNLINDRQIREMKPGCIVINMSRGGIVNEEDMAKALRENRIGGYGTDVMEGEMTEGAPVESPLFECEGFVVTPHIGAQTDDAARAIGQFIAGKVIEFMKLA